MVRCVEMLERKSFGLSDSVIINFVEIHFGWRCMNVVFVRRVTGPISAGGVDLHCDKPISGKTGRNHIHDLARNVAATTKTADNIGGGYELRREFRLGRGPALGDLTDRFRGKRYFVAGGQVQREREAVKNILAGPDRSFSIAPVGGAASTENHKNSFFCRSASAIEFSRIQAAHEEAHPLPASLLARQMQHLPRLSLGQFLRRDDNILWGHEHLRTSFRRAPNRS